MSGGAPPSLDHYNALFAAHGIVSGGGAPLRCVRPDGDATPYEERIYSCGEVPTRPGNWHDAFNAEVWLDFPLAKASMNRRHVVARKEHEGLGGAGRGWIRDRLTQFDECGVLVAGIDDAAWEALVGHRWRELFVVRRAELVATTRFVIFGHASRDALRAPFVGLCGKALRLDAAGDDLVEADAELARRLATTDFSTPFPPLPLLGIPGVVPENNNPVYYDDTRQFRPPRTMPAGSSPDSR